MILYFTYNDQPSGVYWSQVTDVVAHLNGLGMGRVRLFALVSGRGFSATRRAIRSHCPDAIVWPMVPRMQRWRMNAVLLHLLCRMWRVSGIICRGVFTSALAIKARERGLLKRVCFDGRGAYAAEWEEYRIIDDQALIDQFRPLEQDAVQRSDFRIAVSEALVQHWRERYAYEGRDHVVIPCTLGADHLPAVEEGHDRRSEFGFVADDVVLVYSGSTAGWQSFGLLEGLLDGVLAAQPEVKALFLSREDANNRRLVERHRGRVHIHWADPAAVPGLLRSCDHGILLREDSITNRVASPTKFAEYLAAGLPVIISEGLGDFSGAVRHAGLGTVYSPGTSMPRFGRPDHATRQRMRDHAMAYFTKEAHDAAYREVMQVMG